MCPYPLYTVPREEFQKTTCEKRSKTELKRYYHHYRAVITKVHHNISTAIYILRDHISKVNAKTDAFVLK